MDVHPYGLIIKLDVSTIQINPSIFLAWSTHFSIMPRLHLLLLPDHHRDSFSAIPKMGRAL